MYQNWKILDIFWCSYTPACQKLITQYKELVESLRDIVPDVKDFMRKYQVTDNKTFIIQNH